MDTEEKCPSKFHGRDLAIKSECRWCGEKVASAVMGQKAYEASLKKA